MTGSHSLSILGEEAGKFLLVFSNSKICVVVLKAKYILRRKKKKQRRLSIGQISLSQNQKGANA